MWISGVDLVRLRGHNKVVAMESTNFVRPPCNPNLAPFRQDRRMVPFLFGKMANLLSKRESSQEILKMEDALKTLYPIALDNHPLGYLLPVLCTLLGRHLRCTDAAHFAFHLS